MNQFWKNKWVPRLVWWVALPMALIYGFIQFNYPTATFRYKLTAEVMTPDGLKTGSSVIEVSYRDFYSLSGVPNLVLSARGEAVFIRLDDKRVFVVTLTGASRYGQYFGWYDQPPNYIRGRLDLHALPLKVFGLHWDKRNERLLAKQVHAISGTEKKYPAPLQNLPMIVVFDDIFDPDSVKEVDPLNSEAQLGAGFKLQNVWLEITKADPTDTGMKLFPWWPNKTNEWKSKWIFRDDDKMIDQLYYRAFKQPTIVGKAK